ncbi:hypothetical protein C8Q79DRAFT_1012764 [Trametes meyenii]|nr:hypothetical protein C8Q79DRAFT_1012764 [Trametes meyenii]
MAAVDVQHRELPGATVVDLSIPVTLGLPSLDSTLGAVYVGMVVGVMLYGLTVHQTYRYFKLYPSDKFYVKTLVIVIVLLETLHSVLWVIVGYHYLITEALNIPGLLLGHWSVRLTVIETGFAVYACQSYYACRVYLIGPRYRWLVIPAVISMTTGLGFAIAAGIEAFAFTRFITDFRRVSWLVSIAYGFAVSSDVILTSALVFVLQKSRTGSKRTNSILDILIIYTINTGLLTSVVSIAVFIFAIILPGNLIYAGVSIVGAKLYANSVLAVLNSRKSIDNQFMDGFTSFGIGETPCGPTRQVPRGDLESMVWNIPQLSTCIESNISQDMTFATGTEDANSERGVRRE